MESRWGTYQDLPGEVSPAGPAMRSGSNERHSPVMGLQRCRTLLRPGQVVKALATHYDRLAITYRAAVVLSACVTWTRT